MKTPCSNKKKLLLIILIVLICVCVDQLIKISIHGILPDGKRVIISGVLNFTYVENTGGAFGVGSNSIIWFIITNIIIVKSRMSLSDSKRSVITGIFPNSFYCILTSSKVCHKEFASTCKSDIKKTTFFFNTFFIMVV